MKNNTTITDHMDETSGKSEEIMSNGNRQDSDHRESTDMMFLNGGGSIIVDFFLPGE